MVLKQTGQCPKCESTNIWNNSHLRRKGGIYPKRWIMVRISGHLGLKRKYAFKDEYVCINCGYSETFIEEEGLNIIREYGVTDLE